MSKRDRNASTRATNVSSNGPGPPSDSDNPWHVIGCRDASDANASPNFPPTPIQFSGAHSRKSNAPAGASCSAPNRARRRPSPAEASGNDISVRSAAGAATAFAALAFFHHLVARAAHAAGATHVDLELLGAEVAVLVAVVLGELAGVALVRGGVFVARHPAILVGVHHVEAALAFAGHLVVGRGHLRLVGAARAFLRLGIALRGGAVRAAAAFGNAGAGEHVTLRERLHRKGRAAQRQATRERGAEHECSGIAGLAGHTHLHDAAMPRDEGDETGPA